MMWPTDIHYDAQRNELSISFDDGQSFALPAELLRVESPSAEVQGHSPSQKQLVSGKRNIRITAIEAVGNYAIRICFDDGHNTGLYSWTYLSQLGADKDAIWASYLTALTQKGLAR